MRRIPARAAPGANRRPLGQEMRKSKENGAGRAEFAHYITGLYPGFFRVTI